ncbi:MAG TPA: DUF2993 domain-containing protein [Cyanobacteria bacterium UBA11149]|nr:DUF2993 domain-containing protein [Cyanobacteria bacterium UBA11367]HBE59551.1 DUF2993 domain-containing protein [Cyanobacteria bacterium UBA11366]HBK64323.1 DUF2993 domain-containing protein [Cyanobacteria bacterium UBA11166]HBR75568.1 DUF2993 domain-containing protein [Cyanobacteria bacterium UBA11159]HBS72128.1 DUF2993 domain-containing protein [Cyanobacteria bacterium UBA11153]HBW88286.1 DUF2993 domain-containing protein [Cyanobacteria bacterium UBA11149]HCA97324.1 DUF2993 domain-conta
MEFIAILLSSILALGSPVGLAIDTLAENAILSQVERVEELQIRVDNTPNYQVIQGKVQRIRMASRGVWLTPEMRIDTLELETDPIDVDLQRLTRGGKESLAKSLRQPLQTGVRLRLTESDINQALQSPAATAKLQQLHFRLSSGSRQKYQVFQPRIEFLANNRIRFQADIQEGEKQPIPVTLESGLSVTAGQSLQLIDPIVLVDGQPMPPLLVGIFTSGLTNRYNLRSWEDAGITARVLQLKIDTGTLELAGFVQFKPEN